MADAGPESRIDALAERARADRAAFEPPDDPPDEERAMAFLRDGVGPALAVYVEGRSGEWVRFDPDAFDRLERAMNTWLECYAGCYGVDLAAEFTLRTAAEALIDTHDIGDVARVLTKVPERSAEPADP
jgi:hypothetical protein